VQEGLRGESTIAELCRKEGIHSNLYYKWSKEFLAAGIENLDANYNYHFGVVPPRRRGLKRAPPIPTIIPLPLASLCFGVVG